MQRGWLWLRRPCCGTGITKHVRLYCAAEDLIGPLVGGNNGLSREPWGSPAAHLPSLMTVLWCHHISVSPSKGSRKLAKKKMKRKEKKQKKQPLSYCSVKGFPGNGVFTVLETQTHSTQSLTRTSNIRLLLLYRAFCYFPTFWCTKIKHILWTGYNKYGQIFPFFIYYCGLRPKNCCPLCFAFLPCH